MAKFDGLVWKTGNTGWKEIPAGIGYVSKDFDPVTDDASLRVEDKVKAGYGGKKVDFRTVNDLLKACPPGGTVGPGNPPRIIYGAVHPTNLKAAIFVWSAPVIIIDPSKIAGGANASLNGRVMTVECGAVKIDGSDSTSIHIGAGAVGAYGETDDSDAVSVADTNNGVYAGTKNDTSVGDDQISQTTGQKIPIFVPCGDETASVSVSLTYKMEAAKQGCGEPHKIWGACFCLWGTTTPMETFPFGTTMDVNPGSLSPKSGFYGGVVSSGSYVDRGDSFKIAVAGVAGPTVEVDSYNDRPLPLQPGQAVAFSGYLCHTVCGHAKMTQLTDADEALAYVDEDIIKPSERTLPVYTFIETTYYMTTMYGFKTTEIPALTTTELKTELFTSMWQNTSVYDTAVKWSPELKFPQGEISTINFVLPSAPGGDTEVYGIGPIETLLYVGFSDNLGTQIPIGAFDLPVVHNADSSLTGKQFVHTPTNVVAHVFPVGAKAVASPGATGANIKQFAGASYTARFLPNPGAAISAAPDKATLTLTGFNVDQIPPGGQVVTGVGTQTVSSAELVVCGPEGSTVTLHVLVLAGAGSVNVITSIGTAPADPTVISALTFANTLDVITNIVTSPANEVVISTLTSLPDVSVITTVPLADPLLTTAITGSTITLPVTGVFVGTDSIGIAENSHVIPALFFERSYVLVTAEKEVFIVTGDTSPLFVELTKFSKLTDLTAFDPDGTVLTLMKPIPNSTLTLPMIDTTIKIPILDKVGPPDKAVSLLIKNTDGNMKLVGMEDPLVNNETLRTNKGVCVSGSINVLSTPSGDYETDGEIKLLCAIPVRKGKGTAEACPCFTTADPSGGPSPPTDNSVIGGLNPCTLRVRRLQLRECHR